MSITLPRPTSQGLLATFGGACVALSMPPWGIWPLAIVGVVLFEVALGERPSKRRRAARGWLFAAAWMFPSMFWMWSLTAPGYIAAVTVFAGFHALAAVAAPTGTWRVVGRPAAHTLAEALRLVFPFGGVPLATLPIGQSTGPLVGVVRLGGVVLLTWVVFQIGFALAGPSPFVPQMARQRGRKATPQFQGVAALLGAIVFIVLGVLSPTGTSGGGPALRVTAVQGGGEQGTHAINTDPALVVQRHLQATATIPAGSADLVIWPENVVDVATFAGSPELSSITAEAARIGAPIMVGITEDTDAEHFTNAEVVVTPSGEVVSRYDKVKRVPFGEYMPLRGLLHALGAPTERVPRNAVAGHGPGVLEVPTAVGTVKVATAISWEVFFGSRVSSGIDAGATLIANPTNGSSYTGTILQSQQVASSRLRAIEQGRWVVQAAPTGFSAFVSPSGRVSHRTSISEQEVISTTVQLLSGRTLYSRIGGLPFVLLAIVLLALSWYWPGREWWAARRATPASIVVTPPASR